MLVAGLTFSCGLVLGLLVHLPGVYSPSSTVRHRRSSGQFDTVQIGHRSLLQSKDDLNTPLPAHKNTSHLKSDKMLNTFAPISKVGLVRTISTIQQPEARSPSPEMLLNAVEKSSGKRRPEITNQKDTVPVNIKQARVEKGTMGADKYEKARKNSRGDNDINPNTNTSNEIEIGLNNENEADAERVKAEEFNGQTLHDLGIENVVENSIYWSTEVETTVVPRGFTDDDALLWRKTVDDAKVVRITEGCGRMQNRQITFADGTLACARYRLNTDQMQGEVYSYYLAQILNVPNVPPTLLQLADTRTDKWASVDEDVVAAQWHPGKVVALTPWIDNLESVYIPPTLRPQEEKQLYPDQNLAELTPNEIAELVQWSDLIVFDYLTANLDRVVNNMFNLQWNSAMMESPTHNLEKNAESGSLVFLDNESGLFHSYRLLGRYSSYHDELLQSLCVFRKKTAAMIARLYKSRDIGTVLQTTFEKAEPLFRYLPRIPMKNLQTLQSRIDAVYQQITHCQEKFTGSAHR